MKSYGVTIHMKHLWQNFCTVLFVSWNFTNKKKSIKWRLFSRGTNSRLPFGVSVNLRALAICMENPEIPGRIQMERFIPGEIFRKKSNTFQVLPFSRFYRNDRNFLYHLFGLLVPGFMSRESEQFTGIL